MVQTRSHRSVSPKASGKEAPMLPKDSIIVDPIDQHSRTNSSGISLVVEPVVPRFQNSRTNSSGIGLVVEPMVPRFQKANIPKALREQVWIQYYGRVFYNKCPTSWCQNRINAFDFQVGHNVPESKGGSTTIDNLVPICGRCNLSMSNTYTFDEWSATFGSRKRTWFQFFCCCLRRNTS